MAHWPPQITTVILCATVRFSLPGAREWTPVHSTLLFLPCVYGQRFFRVDRPVSDRSSHEKSASARSERDIARDTQH